MTIFSEGFNILFFSILFCSSLKELLSPSIISWEWHPSNVTKQSNWMLCRKFLNMFPLDAEVYGSYFQARINLKVLFSSSRYATFALRYSSSSKEEENDGGDSDFGLHFFLGMNVSSHELIRHFFQSLRLFLGRSVSVMNVGRQRCSKTIRGVRDSFM